MWKKMLVIVPAYVLVIMWTLSWSLLIVTAWWEDAFECVWKYITVPLFHSFDFLMTWADM